MYEYRSREEGEQRVGVYTTLEEEGEPQKQGGWVSRCLPGSLVLHL